MQLSTWRMSLKMIHDNVDAGDEGGIAEKLRNLRFGLNSSTNARRARG
jgi:hypothetical protein